MDDATLIQRINELVAEEEKLLETPSHDAGRVRELEVMLDQCFDLLRQQFGAQAADLFIRIRRQHDDGSWRVSDAHPAGRQQFA